MGKVLIIDDERSIRETLREFVRELGHEAFVASEANAALEIVATSSPDVVLCDIVLPGTDGMTLLERIHRVRPETQVVMITGEPTVETASEAVRQGAFDYLAKPVTSGEIQAVVESALRARQMADDRRRSEEGNLLLRERLEEEVERKGRALRASEEQYQALVETANEAVFVVQDGRLKFANRKTLEITGYTEEKLLSVPFGDLVDPEDRGWVLERYRVRQAGGEGSSVHELRIRIAGGDVRWIEIRPAFIEWEGRPATLALASDVTKRKIEQVQSKKRNEALVELATNHVLYEGILEPALRALTEVSAEALDVDRVAVSLLDPEGAVLHSEDIYSRRSGEHRRGKDYRVSDLHTYLEALETARVLDVRNVRTDTRMAEIDQRTMAKERVVSVLDAGIRTARGLVGDVCFETIDEPREWTQGDEEFAAQIASVVELVLEAVQRRRAEENLSMSEARYRALFEDSPTSLWLEDYSDVKALLDDLRAGGIDDLEGHLLAHPDVVGECISRVRVLDVNEATVALHEATSKRDLLEHVGAIIPAESRAQFVDQLLAIAAGKTSYQGVATDRRLNGDRMHVAIRWSVAPGYEETLSRVLVSKSDITATVEAEAALQQALDDTVEAIGLTTEMRDPYTAGHQRRVTALAVAIARDLDLDEDTIDGIRAAGLTHDIGKMGVPAEILSKPSTLTELEMSLIRAHPEVAYGILESIAFPWPVAEIVLQHHERLDGSGYPSGLTGDQLRLEARILAVADVVEAMASHRPYRAALGVEAALGEIEEHKGVRYDERVVDACLKLFREKRFAFPEGTERMSG
jgi:PAS domain S-box-containing protein/putative nucleotidyltransferase with HDIG domain